MSAPVDLRSDTVTRPTAAMRKAMAEAEVGDDVFGEDPTVRRLEVLAAELTGQARALFVPSGTMANQLAILSWCRRADEVIVGEGAHSAIYESGAGGALAGVQFSVCGTGGHFDAEQMAAALRSLHPAGHVAPTGLVMVENTHNRGGGKVMAPGPFKAICERAREAQVPVHLDGARLFNAAQALGIQAADWARHASSVCICLSKGLGAPIGSLLCGPEAFIQTAHRYRKMIGGGMRQVGILAAAGLIALSDAHQDALSVDHQRAQRFAAALTSLPGLHVDPADVHTNIVIFDTQAPAAEVVEAVSQSVRLLPFGPHKVRAVFHRDLTDGDVDTSIEAFRRLSL